MRLNENAGDLTAAGAETKQSGDEPALPVAAMIPTKPHQIKAAMAFHMDLTRAEMFSLTFATKAGIVEVEFRYAALVIQMRPLPIKPVYSRVLAVFGLS